MPLVCRRLFLSQFLLLEVRADLGVVRRTGVTALAEILLRSGRGFSLAVEVAVKVEQRRVRLLLVLLVAAVVVRLGRARRGLAAPPLQVVLRALLRGLLLVDRADKGLAALWGAGALSMVGAEVAAVSEELRRPRRMVEVRCMVAAVVVWVGVLRAPRAV